MRNLMLGMVVLLVATSVVAGQSTEIQIINSTPNADFYTFGKIHGKLGWSGWALVSESWSEAYVGPIYDPAPWIELGVSAGVETPGARFEECLWVGKGRYSVTAVAEQGASGPWHRIIAKAGIGHGFTLGYHDQAFVGRGLHAGWTKGKVNLRTALLLKDGHVGTIFAVMVSN